MIQIRVQVNKRDVERQLRGIRNGAPRAITRALNRTATTVRAAGVREIARDTALPSSEVRKATEIIRASFSKLLALVIVTGRRIPLLKFRARQVRRGVSYRLPGGRSLAEGAFIAEMRNRHRGVFRRKLPSKRKSAGAWSLNLPIVELFGPSLPRVLAKTTIAAAMRRLAEATLEKNIRHEIAFLLRGRG